MTVIVWKDGILAGDTRVHEGASLQKHATLKVGRSGLYLMGVSGSQTAMAMLTKSLEGGNFPRGLPLAFPEPYCAIVIRKSHHQGWVVKNGYSHEIDIGSAHCIGSAANVAYGALYMGATAEQAVEAAIACSPHCGGTVYSMSA